MGFFFSIKHLQPNRGALAFKAADQPTTFHVEKCFSCGLLLSFHVNSKLVMYEKGNETDQRTWMIVVPSEFLVTSTRLSFGANSGFSFFLYSTLATRDRLFLPPTRNSKLVLETGLLISEKMEGRLLFHISNGAPAKTVMKPHGGRKRSTFLVCHDKLSILSVTVARSPSGMGEVRGVGMDTGHIPVLHRTWV